MTRPTTARKKSMRRINITLGVNAAGKVSALYLGESFGEATKAAEEPPRGILETVVFRNPPVYRRKVTAEGSARAAAQLAAQRKRNDEAYAKAKADAAAAVAAAKKAEADEKARAAAAAAERARAREKAEAAERARAHEALAAEERGKAKG